MSTPYSHLPDYQFHNRELRGVHPSRFDPVVNPRFQLNGQSKIMTMGSCFAQHLSKWLLTHDFNLMLKEEEKQNGGVFSANYGNVYTVQQALQLFERAFGRWSASEELYQDEKGIFYDPLRPSAIQGGFHSKDQALADRKQHESHVKELFLTADVLVFTLGLTEAWSRKTDHAVLPIAPGVVAGQFDTELYQFNNYSFDQIKHSLQQLITGLHSINPKCKVLLTVSPVPLAATYENKHIAVASMASKATLRAVVEEMLSQFGWVDYFPSFEVFFTPGIGQGYFDYDNRHVLPMGVAHAMRLFEKHYTAGATNHRSKNEILAYSKLVLKNYDNVICDEGKIE
jgi:hypothetical protein